MADYMAAPSARQNHGARATGTAGGGTRYPPPPPPPQGWQAGYAPPSVAASTKPSAYWPLTIISFLFSFLIGGIAMYFSHQVKARWSAGNTEGARKASTTALVLGIVGIVVGFFFLMAVLGGSGEEY